MARATSSLPVPVSPWMSTVVSVLATEAASASTFLMAGLCPTTSSNEDSTSLCRWRFSLASRSLSSSISR